MNANPSFSSPSCVSDTVRHTLLRYGTALDKGHLGVTFEYLRYAEAAHALGAVPDQDLLDTLSKLPYVVWARVSSATKRARRRIVMSRLLVVKKAGMDIPPSVVHHVARATIGHGFDEKVVMRIFADKGRTAADKTKTTLADLWQVLPRIEDDLQAFNEHAPAVREQAVQRWMQSTPYADLDATLYTAFGLSVQELMGRARRHLTVSELAKRMGAVA